MDPFRLLGQFHHEENNTVKGQKPKARCGGRLHTVEFGV